MNDQFGIERKIETLENFFSWKKFNWVNKRPKNPLMKCKICLNDIDSSKLSKHSELCMSKFSLLKELNKNKELLNKFISISSKNNREYLTFYRIEKLKIFS